MNTLAVMGTLAFLFIVFGLLHSRAGGECGGGGCSSCGTVCHRSRPDT